MPLVGVHAGEAKQGVALKASLGILLARICSMAKTDFNV